MIALRGHTIIRFERPDPDGLNLNVTATAAEVVEMTYAVSKWRLTGSVHYTNEAGEDATADLDVELLQCGFDALATPTTTSLYEAAPDEWAITAALGHLSHRAVVLFDDEDPELFAVQATFTVSFTPMAAYGSAIDRAADQTKGSALHAGLGATADSLQRFVDPGFAAPADRPDACDLAIVMMGQEFTVRCLLADSQVDDLKIEAIEFYTYGGRWKSTDGSAA